MPDYINPTREYNGRIVALREGQGRMLYILLCRNIIPSFSKGQNTGRPHYPSPTFAIAFSPLFSTLGREIGAPLPAPPLLGVSGDFSGISGRSHPETVQNPAGFSTRRGGWTRSSGRAGRRRSSCRCRNSCFRAEEITSEKFTAVAIKEKISVPVCTFQLNKSRRWRQGDSHLHRPRAG